MKALKLYQNIPLSSFPTAQTTPMVFIVCQLKESGKAIGKCNGRTSSTNGLTLKGNHANSCLTEEYMLNYSQSYLNPYASQV